MNYRDVCTLLASSSRRAAAEQCVIRGNGRVLWGAVGYGWWAVGMALWDSGC